MARGRKNAERLDKEEVRSLVFVGVSMWAIFMVAIICLWVAPKHFGNNSIDDKESTSTNIADSQFDFASSEQSTEQSTEKETQVVATKLTELPAQWENATVKDYLQQMFLTNAKSWGYQASEIPVEVVTDTIINNKWGLPGGIWRQDGNSFLAEEIAILDNYYSTTIANGLYITEIYEEDVNLLAQNLATAGVHVNIIPKDINLGKIGTDGLISFVEAMHNNGISAGIYCNDVSYLKTYMEMGIDLDCIVLDSNKNDSGYRSCMIDASAVRMFFDGAILMKACTERVASAQISKDLICEAVEAGCDAVSVCYLDGDSSARAVYAYGYFIEQESVNYEENMGRLQESVLRLVNLDRSLWQ